MHRDAHNRVRRIELLARLERLDQMIKAHASRAAFVRDKGWDASAYDERTRLLSQTRQEYQSLLLELLPDEQPADDGIGGPGSSPDAA